MTIKATEIRKGQIIILEGELFVVTDREYIAPGNWRAINQIKCRHLVTGNTKQMRMGSSETVEVAYLDHRACTYLYKEGDHYVFMDSENYEQYHLGEELVGDAMKYVMENQGINVSFYESVPLTVDLPAAVVLKVTEAEMAVKGDSVTSDKKGATLETGLEIRVPMYIDAGEYVKVNTATGEFLGRAKEADAPG
ncbi:MAG TPA: elongation factor P [Planctomycetota bacterium]